MSTGPIITEQIEAAPVMTQEQQTEQAVNVAKVHQKTLDGLVRLDLRTYLNQLTAPGVKEVEKVQLKASLERAIMAAIDYGVDITQQGLIQSGRLAKLENAFAAHLARLMDNRMIILADNMTKKELENNNLTEGKTNE